MDTGVLPLALIIALAVIALAIIVKVIYKATAKKKCCSVCCTNYECKCHHNGKDPNEKNRCGCCCHHDKSL